MEQHIEEHIPQVEEYIEWMRNRYAVGLVTFHTKPGQARDVARELSRDSRLDPDSPYYVFVGVRWAYAMHDEETVIAAVRTRKDEYDSLEHWMEHTENELHSNYELNSDAKTVDRSYKDGLVTPEAHDGMP